MSGTRQLCKHRLMICARCIVIDDAAKRINDQVNAVICFAPWDFLVRHCMAFSLADGTTDGVFYPNRNTALIHQGVPTCVFYFRNCPGGTNARDMALFLEINRLAYENDNIAWTDPESPDILMEIQKYDRMRGRVRE